jgi:hypothetical protein
MPLREHRSLSLVFALVKCEVFTSLFTRTQYAAAIDGEE